MTRFSNNSVNIVCGEYIERSSESNWQSIVLDCFFSMVFQQRETGKMLSYWWNFFGS